MYLLKYRRMQIFAFKNIESCMSIKRILAIVIYLKVWKNSIVITCGVTKYVYIYFESCVEASLLPFPGPLLFQLP